MERLVSRAATGARVPNLIRKAVQGISGQPWRIMRSADATAADNSLPEAGNLIMEGDWQSLRWFEDKAAIIRSDFRFKTPMAAAVAEWAGRIQASESVAVHVRRGDYVSNPQAAAVHGAIPASYYAAASKKLLNQGINPRFFIFSDAPDWAANHLQLPGNVSVVRFAADIPDSESLRLMTLCRHAIIANSTFSWWSAWLAEQPGQIVFAPRRWFRAREVSDSFFPLSWQLI
jgi:hypothetical protein